MIRGIIFDLDGTLLNTIEDIRDSMNRVLHARGFPVFDTEDYYGFVGSGLKQLVKAAIPDANDGQVEDCVQGFWEDYRKNWHNLTRPYNGIESMLQMLVNLKIKLAVLSNKPDPFTREMVAHYFSGVPFVYVMGHRNDYPIKPDPASTMMIMRKLQCHPSETAFIGDSDVDMQTAVRASALPIGVSWGFRPREELLANGARFILESPQSLPELIENN